MSSDRRGADWLVMALLAVLPALAHAPAWWEGRLLGPGDGAALHYPLKAAVWDAYRHGELPSWNPSIFLGTPLLASYHPGALFPLLPALSFLPPFVAFQTTVLLSLAGAGVLVFLYVRRLGGSRMGGYFAGLSFSIGPYLVAHVGDTATLMAAPTLPLLLLATEAHLREATAWRRVGLSLSVALVLLAGSPEAARAGGALLAGRLLVALLSQTGSRLPVQGALLAALSGILLAAPQLLPTLIAARDAGPGTTGMAELGGGAIPGAWGMVLRYASHTPSPCLALAALPLARVQMPVRVLGAALFISLILQWGRGPLAAPGALALLFDLTLSILAGLSLSAQWRSRNEALGRRLRAYFLCACLASAAALSVAASALGPLPETLAGAVGILALALILYFPNAESSDPLRARIWLLPLTASFLLQPHGRATWQEAPTREDLHRGTGTREAIDRVMGPRRGEANLSLVGEWPQGTTHDLAFANLAVLSGRRNVNGYDPMVSLRSRTILGGMSGWGTLPEPFFRTDPARLEWLGVRWVQLPVTSLRTPQSGKGGDLNLVVKPRHARFFPLPIAPATEIRLISHLSGATDTKAEEPVAFLSARLASGRDFSFPIRAGIETSPGAPRDATLILPGRYFVDGLRIERLGSRGLFALSHLSVRDAPTGRVTAVSLPSAYVSDMVRFREVAATPVVRLFEVPGSLGHAHVVERMRILTDEHVLQDSLASFDARHEALLLASEVGNPALPPGSRSSRAEVVGARGGWIEVRAQGPGFLVVAETWDHGWTATLDEGQANILRTNHVQIGLVLPEGMHRIVLRYRPPGFLTGAILAAVGTLLLALGFLRRAAQSR